MNNPQQVAPLPPLSRYDIECHWKGKEAHFEVWASDFAKACETARKFCKKATGLPMSSVYKVHYIETMGG